MGYRRDLPRLNISDTEQFIEEKRPRYMVISVYEQIKDFEYWTTTYPQEHQDTLIPVKVYSQNNQPMLVVYEFRYKN